MLMDDATFKRVLAQLENTTLNKNNPMVDALNPNNCIYIYRW
jgi:hypothetical protein